MVVAVIIIIIKKSVTCVIMHKAMTACKGAGVMVLKTCVCRKIMRNSTCQLSRA